MSTDPVPAAVESFRVHVDDSVLRDLRVRLDLTAA